QGFDLDEVATGRDEEIRKAVDRELGQNLRDTRLLKRVKDRELFALAFVRNAGNGEDLHVCAGGLLQCFFDAAISDHLTTDLRETETPAGYCQEPSLIQDRNVARDVPAVTQDVSRPILPPQVPSHDVGTSDQQHAGSIRWQWGETVRIDDLNGRP